MALPIFNVKLFPVTSTVALPANVIVPVSTCKLFPVKATSALPIIEMVPEFNDRASIGTDSFHAPSPHETRPQPCARPTSTVTSVVCWPHSP